MRAFVPKKRTKIIRIKTSLHYVALNQFLQSIPDLDLIVKVPAFSDELKTKTKMVFCVPLFAHLRVKKNIHKTVTQS